MKYAHLLSRWLEAYLILCNIKRHWCLLTESEKVLLLNSSSSLVSNCPALGCRDPNRWAHKRTAWTSWILFVESADESMLNKTLRIFVIMMLSGSSGSSARSGSNPSRSMCSAIAHIRRADILGVFTCQMDKGSRWHAKINKTYSIIYIIHKMTKMIDFKTPRNWVVIIKKTVWTQRNNQRKNYIWGIENQ